MMKNSQEQAFCIADGGVDPRECVARFLGRRFLPMVRFHVCTNGSVGRIRVGDDDCIGLKQPLSTSGIDRSLVIGKMLHPQATGRLSLGALARLNRHKDRLLSDTAAASVEQFITWFRRLVSCEISIIQFYQPRQLNRFIRPAHRFSNLLHHVPKGFIPLHAQSLLHVLRRNRLRCAGHQKHTGVPSVNRQLAVHHERATTKCGFRLAIQAFPPIARAQPAQSRGIATAATDASIFTLFFHVLNTGGFIRESFEKLVGRHGFRFETKSQPSLLNLSEDYIETDNHSILFTGDVSKQIILGYISQDLQTTSSV